MLKTNMSSNWQDSLQSLLNSGNLPEGEERVTTENTEAPKSKDRLVISMEKKGRGGKIATIISGFTLERTELEALATTIKTRLGTGGSARGGEILVQGDRRDDVKKLLVSLGYRV